MMYDLACRCLAVREVVLGFVTSVLASHGLRFQRNHFVKLGLHRRCIVAVINFDDEVN